MSDWWDSERDLDYESYGPPCCTVCDSWLDGGNETGVCDYCARDPYLDGSR